MIFGQVVELISEGVLLLDLNGQIKYANQAAARILGEKINSLLGQNFLRLAEKIKTEVSYWSAAELFQEALKSQKPLSGEYSLKTEHGAVFFVLQACAHYDVSGQQTGVVIVLKDITAQRRLEETLTWQIDTEKKLNEINTIISSSLEIDKIVQKVLAKAAEVVNCKAAVVCLREGNHWILRYALGPAKPFIGMVLAKEQSYFLRLASRLKQAFILENIQKDEHFANSIWRVLGTEALLVAPLLFEGSILGATAFLSFCPERLFTQQELSFVQQLTLSLSLALYNAQKYAEEHYIALTLQEALMTMPKSISGLDFGYLYRSASPGAKVGGDFYDLFTLDKDRVAVVIGDVSGHGLEAAALTSVVKNTVRAYALAGDAPAAVMAKTNRIIYKSTSLTTFVTLFLGYLSKTQRILQYVSAGHPSVILRRQDDILTLKTSGPVIGQFKDATYQEYQQSLNKGDILIFYTDGLIEARVGQEFFGEKRLLQTVANLNFTSVKEIPQLVFANVHKLTGGQLRDDVAILAIGT